jgi:hypothetical protein
VPLPPLLPPLLLLLPLLQSPAFPFLENGEN